MRQKFRNQEPALSSWGCRRFRCNPDIDSTSIIIHSVLYEMSLAVLLLLSWIRKSATALYSLLQMENWVVLLFWQVMNWQNILFIQIHSIVYLVISKLSVLYKKFVLQDSNKKKISEIYYEWNSLFRQKEIFLVFLSFINSNDISITGKKSICSILHTKIR